MPQVNSLSPTPTGISGNSQSVILRRYASPLASAPTRTEDSRVGEDVRVWPYSPDRQHPSSNSPYHERLFAIVPDRNRARKHVPRAHHPVLGREVTDRGFGVSPLKFPSEVIAPWSRASQRTMLYASVQISASERPSHTTGQRASTQRGW